MIVSLLAFELAWRLLNPPLTPSNFRGAIAATLPLALVCVFAIPTRCQHFGWSIIYGSIIGAGAVAAPIVLDLLLRGSFLAALRPTALASFATVCLIGAPFGAVALLAWTAACKYLLQPIVIQDGTLCPTCAYCITYLPRNVCPECGHEFVPAALTAAVKRVRPWRLHRTFCVRTVVFASLVLVSLLIALRFFQLTPPLYALWDGRFWGYALAGTEKERQANLYLPCTMIADEASRGRSVTPAEVRSILGPPDLFVIDGDVTCYLYFFCSRPRSLMREEAYLDFVGGNLKSVGFNVSGVNDLSRWSRYDGSR